MKFRSLIFCALFVGEAQADLAVEADLAHLARIAEPDEVDRGIARGLAWMVEQQDMETGRFAGQLGNTNTALATMALMAAGHLPGRSEYGEHVRKGILFLAGVAEAEDGYFGNEGNGRMYAHGICSLALSEAYGMMPTDAENRRVKEALLAANRVTFGAQVTDESKGNHFGGWRYQPRPNDADLSVTVWFILTLRSTQNAQLPVPEEVMTRAMDYVRRTWHEERQSYSYQPGNNQSPSMRTAGVVAMLAMGDNEEPALRARHEASMEFLNDFDPLSGRNYFYYQSYYVATAANMIGEAQRESFLPRMERALLSLQNEDGSFKKHRGHDGGVYATAFALLTLSIRYQYLPIYQE
ncbi:MAG: terpene cyclase/mutase family protein [Verrucomicrobia bacterium]|nr:terpene cyclase/mutase family protein [Verrucomicrobiota bacterium]MCH8525602.1 terpene cyclase/mutase family protein [Kiritimatiellia bacterium]